MWPYTDAEESWLARSTRASKAVPAHLIPEIVVRQGQEHIYRLADAIASVTADTASSVGRWFRRRQAGRSAGADRGEELRQPLTSIRSAAEILRDNPTLAPDQRARMLDLIIAESDRLDRLIGASPESA